MPGIEHVEVAVAQSTLPADPTVGALPHRLSARLLRPWMIPLALAVITIAVFSPALWNGFVEWDDQINLYKNPDFRGLTWPQIRWMFSNVLMGHWIPLTWLTFGLDYVLWEMNPFGYHLTSLLIFAANVPAFYFVALRLLRQATSFGERLRYSWYWSCRSSPFSSMSTYSIFAPFSAARICHGTMLEW